MPPCHRGLALKHRESTNENIKCLYSHYPRVTSICFAWHVVPQVQRKKRNGGYTAVLLESVWKQFPVLFLLFSNGLWLIYCIFLNYFFSLLIIAVIVPQQGGKSATCGTGCAVRGWRRRSRAELAVALPSSPVWGPVLLSRSPPPCLPFSSREGNGAPQPDQTVLCHPTEPAPSLPGSQWDRIYHFK